MNQLLTTSQVANLTGYTRKTIAVWCEDQTFESAIKWPANKPKAQWRIPASDPLLVSMAESTDTDLSELASAGRADRKTIAKLQAQVEELTADYAKLYQAYQTAKKEEAIAGEEAASAAEKIESLTAEMEQYRAYYQRTEQAKRGGNRNR